MKLLSLRGGWSSSASSPRPSADPLPGSEDAPLEVLEGRPSKRAQVVGSGKAKAGSTKPRVAGVKRAERKEGPSRDIGGPSQGAAGKRLRPPAMDDLYGIRAGDDEPLWSLVMGELPPGEATDPLVARWKGLSRGDKVWAGGDLSATFLRGAELEKSENSAKELQRFLRLDRVELRLLKSEALTLTKKAEKAEAEARAASSALAEETRLRPIKDKEAIEAYKKSEGFELGLTRMGRVSYEYGYKVALGRFRACPPSSEVEEDPFSSHPEDQDVDMPEDVPFDDRPKTPEE
ncbi:hypothetical protein C4D60_Mb07t04370 [Musa balbisiana]|uniref:Uncharacterized protein n=1 Tax=Musa balbisiana TaxID=52838 RepID=A0A4S8JCW2_MUSBA|nr:hypothetical protein C4D60_Mb07t04370 [Musa balbisiana]